MPIVAQPVRQLEQMDSIKHMHARLVQGEHQEKELNIADGSVKNMVDSANIKSIKRMLGPSKLNIPDKEVSLERHRRNESKMKH